MKRKVYLIGIDGGSPKLLKLLIREGYLPNFKKIMEDGVFGSLESTIPPVTAPAWTSMMTGVNPGKHGLFSFEVFSPKGNGIRFASSRSARTKRLWEILNDFGKSSGIINCPLTYPPPKKMKGFLISGFLTPRDCHLYTYPPQIRDKFLRDYIIDIPMAEFGKLTIDNLRKFVDRSIECLRKRERILFQLDEKFDPDFLMSVFMETDKLQHVLWKFLVKEEEGDEIRVMRENSIRYYSEIDRLIGRILGRMEKNSILIIASDHGFESTSFRFFLNEWLRSKGHLAFKGIPYLIRRVFRRLIRKLQDRGMTQFGLEREERLRSRFIDWEKTKAFVRLGYEQGIYLNEKVFASNEEKRKFVDELIGDLRKCETLSGEPLFKRIWIREELYKGPFIQFAPHIVLEKDERVVLSEKLYSRKFVIKNLLKKDQFIEKVCTPEGYHSAEGFFAAYGNAIARNVRGNFSIMDIVPTILYFLELPIPSELDGRVIDEIFVDEFRKNVKVTVSKEYEIYLKGEDFDYEEEEEDEIYRKLKGLGYLD